MLSFKFDRMIKKFIDKQKQKELSPPKTALQEMLETSVSEKEKIATRTRKIMKGKTSWVKAHRQ